MSEYCRVYAKIDLDAIVSNIRAVKEKIGPNVNLLAVIKADAYGHGAVKVSEVLENEPVDYFGIAVIEEGILLRKNGVKKPMLILGYTDPSQYEDLIRYQITQTVFTYDMAKALSETAKSMHATAKIHIKLDTGMTRIGFKDNEESVKTIQEISKLEGIEIEGMFTHFSKADEEDTTYTKKQFKRYMDFAKRLEEVGVSIPIKHVANSAGIMEFEETYLDQVRSGIITYGLYPSEEVHKENLALKPAMELKTHVVFVKDVEPDTMVSYGGTFITKETTKIATIPVGYGDGYPRSLSNKGKVIIHGQYAPIIGRVCMDQFMVDVSNIEGVANGDVVTLVGKDQDAFISVEDVAALSYSFNYEFVCDLGRRIPRVYVQNGKVVEKRDYLKN